MPADHFFRVDRQTDDGVRHYVVHSTRPRFSILIDPHYNPEGKPGRGFVKSVRIANGWGNDYRRCIQLINAAETYFREQMQREKKDPDPWTSR